MLTHDMLFAFGSAIGFAVPKLKSLNVLEFVFSSIFKARNIFEKQ